VAFLGEVLQILTGWDYAILLLLNHWLAGSPRLAMGALRINQSADFFVACCLVALWFSTRFGDVRRRLILFVISLPAAYAVARVLQKLILRPRPLTFVALEPPMPEQLWMEDRFAFQDWGSLPSDHAVLLSLFMVFLFSINRRIGWASAAFLGFFSLFRIGFGYHWPSDMIAGLVGGSALAWIALRLDARLKPLLDRLLQFCEAHPSVAYPLAFVWLLDFSHGFEYVQLFARDVLRTSIFH
jgi:undecaprenyl-diphosphatase